MYDLKLYNSNVIEIEQASCVGYIGYISANIITKKEEKEKGMGRKKTEGKRKGKGKRTGKKNDAKMHLAAFDGPSPKTPL